MKNTYADFLEKKKLVAQSSGKTINSSEINPILFPFQRDIVVWALRKARACMFEDTGLGKTFQQLEWARLTGVRTLIIAPLMVVRQTVKEGAKLGINVESAGSNGQIEIINYEQIHNINAKDYGAVVLDESSILKSIGGKTRKLLTKMFAATPYKLCCTATPAPNDSTEICNHIEFLGHMTADEAKSMFFVNDAKNSVKWRLKQHAVQPFYKWLSSWSISIQKPSDLGYDDAGYVLPELTINPIFVDSDIQSKGFLFFQGLKGIQDRSRVRRLTIKDRVEAVIKIIKNSPDQWILWCGMNDEGRMLYKLSGDKAELMEGSNTTIAKVEKANRFISGECQILITKPKMMRFGMNLQNCHKMVFVGLSDSWESYYQCIRRCYRFGQKHPVEAYIILSEAERAIYQNVMNKEHNANKMRRNLIELVKDYEKLELGGGGPMKTKYKTDDIKTEDYHLMLGDSAERLKEIESDSIGLSVYSPPFASLYTYSPSDRDLGNSKTERVFFKHFKYIIDELLRTTMPGRLTCCHISQIAAMLVRDGYIGMKDFRGKTIKAFIKSGWIFHGEVCIDKNPQAQAIRTHSLGLLFATLKKDGTKLRPAIGDFVLVFRKPGDNEVPVKPNISNDDWIRWAHPIWYDIRETNTLNAAEGRGKKDERHICPLQLDVIERCIRLYSNEGDTVLTPFMGIGSEVYQALLHNRKAIGIELKETYYKTAIKNARRALRKKKRSRGLLDNNDNNTED